MKFTILFVVSLLTVVSYDQAQHPPQKNTTPTISGEALYKQYCLSCHQADGTGVPGLNPPLIKTSYVLGKKQRLAQILLNGFNEDVEINGAKYENAMPAFNQLTNRQIAAVLTYVRSNFGNKASRVNAAEVGKERAKKKISPSKL